jgi:hypothetical protein
LFYDKHYELCGERTAHAHILCEVTHIDIRALLHDSRLSNFSIAERMHWAVMRETTREEDMAYCLFGIFDVQLAPLYGEGPHKAFKRLQEEIIKTYIDLSFLVWDCERPYRLGNGLVQSPEDFRGIPRMVIRGDEYSRRLEPIQMTNKGLRVTLPLVP